MIGRETKMKTSELTGTALNWAVAKCEHPHLVYGETIGVHHASNQIVIPEFNEPECYYNPSTNWAQGGPIIERERIWVQPEIGKEGSSNAWCAISMNSRETYGPTLLIAAMRCYCCAKLGKEIEIPKELL